MKAENIATFLGRKLHGNFQDELGNDFNTRIQGTRIKHHMGPASIKMYDKHGLVLRIETTANNVSFFKHHRRVEHRDRTSSKKIAPVACAQEYLQLGSDEGATLCIKLPLPRLLVAAR